MDEQDTWEQFGSMFVEKVRDDAIKGLTLDAQESSKGIIAIAFRNALQTSNISFQQLMTELGPYIVDSALQTMLHFIYHQEAVDLTFRTADGESVSIKRISDGLAGDLILWIREYSKYGSSIIDIHHD